MPKQINTPWPGQALVRLFGLKGRYQPVLDETIVPVVQVDIGSPPEVIKWAMAGAVVAAVVGELSYARMENPAGSGVNINITRILAQTAATQPIGLDLWGVLPGMGSRSVVAPMQFADTEFANRATKATLFDGTATGIVIPWGYRAMCGSSVANAFNESNLPIRVVPGAAINLGILADNVQLTWGMIWSETAITLG